MNAFDILMVLALGSLAGTGIGLVIGYLAKKWGKCTPIISRNLEPALVIVCSCICIACLAWISSVL
jgi:hypothetical protein